MEDLTSLRNIGATVAARLAEVGITSRADLKQMGAPEAYRRLVARNRGRALPVCYYLYSLQAALEGVHWNEIGETKKLALLKAIGRGKKRARAS